MVPTWAPTRHAVGRRGTARSELAAKGTAALGPWRHGGKLGDAAREVEIYAIWVDKRSETRSRGTRAMLRKWGGGMTSGQRGFPCLWGRAESVGHWGPGRPEHPMDLILGRLRNLRGAWTCRGDFHEASMEDPFYTRPTCSILSALGKPFGR